MDIDVEKIRAADCAPVAAPPRRLINTNHALGPTGRLAAGGEDILFSGSGGLRALAAAAGIRVCLIGSGPPGSPVRVVACQSGSLSYPGSALSAVPAWPGTRGFED